jgi:hypothetical protein
MPSSAQQPAISNDVTHGIEQDLNQKDSPRKLQGHHRSKWTIVSRGARAAGRKSVPTV